nr:cytochrome c-type biogenesis protein CcmB [uncultured bacterium]BAH90558.1 cytochrome c-type biogenesis protein CcmB [uncultured bacterium]
MKLFSAQFRREWFLLIQNSEEALNPLLFLFLAISLFALATGGGADVLRDYAPAIIWVLVLLANLLSLEGLFRRDYEDGTLELLVLKAEPAFLAILAKVLVHWMFSGLAMTLLAPVAALILYLPASALPTLILVLLVGTPALSLIGAVGAALTVGLKRGGALLALLVLPMYVPILIFGAGAVLEQMDGIETLAQIYWLGVITMASLTLAPFAVQAAIRVSLEQ